jgi:hypothetical protein
MHVAAVVCLVLWTGPALAVGQVEAKERFEKGVALFKNADYEGALVEFKSAYESKPHFAVRYNISICLYKLHRYAEAQEEMEAYLEEGGDGIPGEKRQEIETILVELSSLVGTLKVTSNVEGAVLEVDGEALAALPMASPCRLDVGEYEISIVAEGYEPHTTTLVIPGGKAMEISVELVALPGDGAPAPKRKPVPGGVFWAGAGLSVALAAGAAVTGGLAMKKHDEYAGLDYEDAGWEKVQNEGRSLVLTSNVLWGVTGAVAVTTVVLAFFTDFTGGKEKRQAAVKLVPDLRNPGLSLVGAF